MWAYVYNEFVVTEWAASGLAFRRVTVVQLFGFAIRVKFTAWEPIIREVA